MGVWCGDFGHACLGGNGKRSDPSSRLSPETREQSLRRMYMALKEQPSRSNKPAEWSPYDDRQADQPISDVDAFLFPYEERPAAPTSSAFPSASSLAIKKYANAPQLVNSRQARDWYYRAARNGATSYKEQPSKLSSRVWLDLMSALVDNDVGEDHFPN